MPAMDSADGQTSYSFREYDNYGNVISTQWVDIDDGVDLEAAQKDLVEMGAKQSNALRHLADMRQVTTEVTVTGAKDQPDNADGVLFFGFKATVPSDQVRSWHRVSPMIEVGRPWRRGLGLGFLHQESTRIYGVWIPWRRPRRPKAKVVQPKDLFISTVRLAGNE